MTFLNPLYLIALAAASIPIILHLLNLRKAKVVEFSSLAFLKEMQKSNIRRLKLRQWLLLALRTLIIIFIVLAFTRPAMRTSFSFLPGTSARSSVVILFDDSFSMDASDEGGPLFRQARTRAQEILSLLKPGDEAVLLPLSAARRSTHRFSTVTEAVRQEVQSLQPSFVHGAMADGLVAASALFEESGNINKELYIITDGQKSHFSLDRSLPSRALDPSVHTYLLTVGDRPPDNAAVTDVEVVNSVFQIDRPVTVRASVSNFGGSPVRNSLVSVFLNGTRVMQKAVDVEAGATLAVEFPITPKTEGFVQGRVELEDDALPMDNSRSFSFYVPKELRILLSPGGSRAAEFLRLALQPSDLRIFSIETMDKGRLATADFSRFDAVILVGPEDLGPALLQRLAGYVAQGGGLFLTPSPDGRLGEETRILLSALGLPPAAGFAGSIGSTAGFSSFSTIDFDHPLFQGVFEKRTDGRPPEVESPRIRAYLRLRGADSSHTVIGLGSGDPFLLDHRHGKGRVLALAVAPDLGWSDFPLKGLFLPLLHRAMFSLASREEFVIAVGAGLPFELILPSGLPIGAFLTLASTDGKELRLPVRPVTSGFAITCEGIDQPGVYTARSGTVPLRSLVVNGDPRESDLARLASAERLDFFAKLGMTRVATLGRNDDIAVSVTQGRFGMELWKYCVLAAILCALLEMLVARGPWRFARSRD